MNVLFAGPVKMELCELIVPAVHNQKVSGSWSVVVIHADGFAVVDQVLERAALVFESQGRELSFLRISNIDGRLLFAVFAGGICRIQVAPVFGSF